jgi:hypothetical protein
MRPPPAYRLTVNISWVPVGFLVLFEAVSWVAFAMQHG